MLLTETALLETLQNCTSRPITAAPLVLAGLMTVIPRLVPIDVEKLRTTAPLGLQLNCMRSNLILLCIGRGPLLILIFSSVPPLDLLVSLGLLRKLKMCLEVVV